MEEIFKPLVDAIVEMIEGQIQDANVKKGAQIGVSSIAATSTSTDMMD